MTRDNNLFKATLEELRAFEMPPAENQTFGEFIIVPMGEEHESGWGCMKFILLKHGGEPIATVGGFSDVVHLNGIGGYGKFDIKKLLDNKVERIDWTIDCLPKSGCLRFFVSKNIDLSVEGYVLSDFQVIGERRKIEGEPIPHWRGQTDGCLPFQTEVEDEQIY